MDEWWFGAIGVLTLFLVFCFGWAVSVATIVSECEKLDAFYAGQTVYECKKKEPK